MKELFFINDSLNNKISYYHMMVLLVTLPFDQFYSHLVFASFALHTLIHLQKGNFKNLLSLKVLLLQAVFFITLLSCVYTKYPASAITDITQQLIILLFPLFVSLNSLNLYKYRDNLLFIFSGVCLLTVIYLYLHAFYIIYYFKLPLHYIFASAFISHNFSMPIGMHATFFSLQIALALFFFVSQLVTRKQNRILFLIASVVLFSGVIQLGSKAVLAAILFSANVVIPYFLISGKKRMVYTLIVAALSGIVIIGVWHTSSFKERYVTEFKKDLTITKPDEAIEPRLIRWEAAMQLVKLSPVIGYGAGSELPVLADKYFNEKLYNAFLNHLNAHNQYITFLLITGAIGLLVYLATLYTGFKTGWQKKDVLLFLFILLITSVSFSESLLNAEKGIWFYALFFSFFMFSQSPAKAAQVN